MQQLKGVMILSQKQIYLRLRSWARKCWGNLWGQLFWTTKVVGILWFQLMT